MPLLPASGRLPPHQRRAGVMRRLRERRPGQWAEGPSSSGPDEAETGGSRRTGPCARLTHERRPSP